MAAVPAVASDGVVAAFVGAGDRFNSITPCVPPRSRTSHTDRNPLDTIYTSHPGAKGGERERGRFERPRYPDRGH